MIALSILWYLICSAILQLLFVFFCFCSGVDALINTFFYGTKGKPTQCLMCLADVAVGGGRTRTQRSPAPFSPWCLFFFICEQHKNAICPNALCLFFQYIKHYFTALLLFFLDLFLLGTFSGKQMELVALKVRHIWTAVNALHCSNLRLQYNKGLHMASKRFAENYHLMLHFPSALQNVLVLISSCSRQLFSSKSSTTQSAGIISQHFKLSMVPKSFCYYIALQYN